MKSIQHQPSLLPTVAPVMFLSSVMLPNVMQPLFIFEPRYRQMLAHCLEHQRMFCIALLKPGVEEAREPGDFFPIAGLGLLRACVGHPDGTSHLVLQGLARVELRGFVQKLPFRIAEISELASKPTTAQRAAPLADELRRRCLSLSQAQAGTREQLEEQIGQIHDPGHLCDLLAHTFLQSPFQQQEILEELNVAKRSQKLFAFLDAEQAEG